jgi:hypothetical protein
MGAVEAPRIGTAAGYFLSGGALMSIGLFAALLTLPPAAAMAQGVVRIPPLAPPQLPGAAAKAAAPTAPFDFKSIPLGIGLAEFRALPHPDGEPRSRVICTGAKGPFGPILDVAIYGETDQALGVVKCIFYGHMMAGADIDRALGLRIGASGYASYEYGFMFVPPAHGAEPQLYKIELSTNANAMSAAVSALTEKYGAGRCDAGKVQAVSGALFDRRTCTWNNGVSSILARSPSDTLDHMELVFTHRALSAIVERAEAERQAAIKNKI